MSRRGKLLVALLVALLLLSAIAAVWFTVLASGHPPSRWLAYVERRLEGHPRLETVAGPVIHGIRLVLGEDRQLAQRATPWTAPAPPTRWAVAASEASANQPAPAGRVLRVGPQGQIPTIAQAARLARDGDVVEIEAGDYRGDVAVWPQKLLTIRGVGGNARIHADGRSAEGKAIWVLREGVFDIANVDFIGARVADRNGAGIRMEGGWVTVRNCLFWDSESGILVGGSRPSQAQLEVYGSEFGYIGDGRGLAHAIYAGAIARLKVSGSYFHHGNVGHLIKSRAAVNDIRYNRITDESSGRASYQLDLSHGGVAFVVGNLIQQGPMAENGTLIAFGLEGYRSSVNALYLVNNTLVNDLRWGGAMLRAAPGATQVTAANNIRVGAGRYHVDGALQVLNDVALERGQFVDEESLDYRLRADADPLRWQAPLASHAQGVALIPEAEYQHPRQVLPRQGPPRVPGAFAWPAAGARPASGRQ